MNREEQQMLVIERALRLIMLLAVFVFTLGVAFLIHLVDHL